MNEDVHKGVALIRAGCDVIQQGVGLLGIPERTEIVDLDRMQFIALIREVGLRIGVIVESAPAHEQRCQYQKGSQHAKFLTAVREIDAAAGYGHGDNPVETQIRLIMTLFLQVLPFTIWYTPRAGRALSRCRLDRIAFSGVLARRNFGWRQPISRQVGVTSTPDDARAAIGLQGS
ncbi:hypothetical protein [Ralstonia solanacearum]|uniref:hypothetical protein n=1 Tax=Ralstonia solanacearum TaxID=305 RepID=UPI003CC633C1